MASSISGISQINQLLPSLSDASALGVDSSKSKGADFQSMLLDVLGQANKAGMEAQQAVGDYQLDTGISKPEVFIALRKAELALRTTMQIRNKLVEAFDEIQQMRM